MPRTLTLVRHAPTPANRQRRYLGHRDEALDVDGVASARGLRRRLAHLLPSGPDQVWSSDLERARRTAEIAFPAARIRTDPRLREMDFGAFDGHTYRQNLERHGPRFRRWIEDPDRNPPPEGEALRPFTARVVSWLRDRNGIGEVVAVTHGGPLRVLAARVLGLPFRETLAWRIPPATVVRTHLREDHP